MTHNLTYIQAQDAVKDGMFATREAWGSCRIIRPGVESDWDFINYDPTGVVIDDCKEKVCDCSIGIYQPTEEDKNTRDWIIMSAEEAK